MLNATYLTRFLAPEFETLLVVGEKEGHEQDASYLARRLGIEVVTIPSMGRSINAAADWDAYRQLKRLMRAYKPQVVHTHAAKPGALGRVAAHSLGVPAIVHTYHGHVFHSYFNQLKTNVYIQTERWLARRTHAIVAISDQQRKELVHDFRIAPASKFHLIRLGLDLDKFGQDQEAKRATFRTEYNVGPDEVSIGIIGRLVPVKNHDLFLEALHHVLRNTRKKVKAFIIGDGETRSRLEALARSKGIAFSTERDVFHQHPLVFTSWRQDVDVVMAGLDIVTLTSLNEGTPVSLIEAQAACRPIVSTRVGGIQDIVAENETALLADIDDTVTFCDHLLRLVNDKELRYRMGAHSAHRVVDRFGYQRLMCEMASLYYHLLDQNNPHALLSKKSYANA